MTPKEIQKEHMLSCMKAALAVWDLIDLKHEGSSAQEPFLLLEVNEVGATISPFFPLFTPITEEQKFEVMNKLGLVVEINEISSCGCFNFAHMLDHIFDLEKIGASETPN